MGAVLYDDGIHRAPYLEDVVGGQGRGERGVEGQRHLVGVFGPVDLRRRVVVHEAHVLARPGAIESPVFLQRGEHGKAREEHAVATGGLRAAGSPLGGPGSAERLEVRQRPVVAIRCEELAARARLGVIRSGDPADAREVMDGRVQLGSGDVRDTVGYGRRQPALHIAEERQAPPVGSAAAHAAGSGAIEDVVELHPASRVHEQVGAGKGARVEQRLQTGDENGKDPPVIAAMAVHVEHDRVHLAAAVGLAPAAIEAVVRDVIGNRGIGEAREAEGVRPQGGLDPAARGRRTRDYVPARPVVMDEDIEELRRIRIAYPGSAHNRRTHTQHPTPTDTENHGIEEGRGSGADEKRPRLPTICARIPDAGGASPFHVTVPDARMHAGEGMCGEPNGDIVRKLARTPRMEYNAGVWGGRIETAPLLPRSPVAAGLPHLSDLLCDTIYYRFNEMSLKTYRKFETIVYRIINDKASKAIQLRKDVK